MREIKREREKALKRGRNRQKEKEKERQRERQAKQETQEGYFLKYFFFHFVQMLTLLSFTYSLSANVVCKRA